MNLRLRYRWKLEDAFLCLLLCVYLSAFSANRGVRNSELICSPDAKSVLIALPWLFSGKHMLRAAKKLSCPMHTYYTFVRPNKAPFCIHLGSHSINKRSRLAVYLTAIVLLVIPMLKVVPNIAMKCCLNYKMMCLLKKKMCIVDEFPPCPFCRAIGYDFNVEETTAHIK